MSDKFFTIPGEGLLRWILEEEKRGQIFGIPKESFYKPFPDSPLKLERYGKILETPLGVAAGPHTQMAQNIISAWLTGARYIELKTIQTLDELDVSKPCIDMEDEGYNCEWSQELKIKESFTQYLTAWVIIHILRHKWGWDKGQENSPGFIFNMSVGYNMEGILKKNVQWFLEKLDNCRSEKEELCESLLPLYPSLKDIEIPDRISDNITLSTMHGCPPQEIEAIAMYLVNEKKLHTTVKLNPTLLGPEVLREILNRKLGFEVNVPDEAFEHDLKYPDAVNMIKKISKAAKKAGVDFSLKLTNTLECLNHRTIFPAKEKMMYMSGKPLHPLSINLAAKLQEDFSGELDISFCAGVDCFNFAEVIGSGLKPVTVCSDILKPGGYARLPQYLDNLSAAFAAHNAASIDEYILAKQGKPGSMAQDVKKAALLNLKDYAQKVIDSDTYSKNHFPGTAMKTARPLQHFDCIQAPCTTTCPTNQDVPAYMYYASQGDYKTALEIILEQNPFPGVTGNICDQTCISRCTRANYDNPLHIRAIKGFISDNYPAEPELIPNGKKECKVAVIGAGPSGLACAFYLALAGIEVNVYETRDIPGGMISRVIPQFRLKDEDLRKDIQRIESLGVKLHYNTRINLESFKHIHDEYDYTYIAVGAESGTPLNIKGEDLPGVMDALTFLTRVRNGETLGLGTKVAVVGGGNSAMDAARTAKRLLQNPDAQVTILYRRSRKEMPAIEEEIQAALKENITITELTSPVEFHQDNNQLKALCWKMKLGEIDDSGRRKPVKIENSDFYLYFDTIITAVGQTLVLDFIKDQQWLPIQDNGLTAIENIYMGGDARRGPSSIITAVADGKKAARTILNALSPSQSQKNTPISIPSNKKRIKELASHAEKNYLKKPLRIFSSLESEESLTIKTTQEEAQRCLLCSEICNVCVTVCPNRANIPYTVNPKSYSLQKVMIENGKVHINDDAPFLLSQKYQVYNIADFCNECGNCRTFCPTNGAPYKDKPKICLTEECFLTEPNSYYAGEKDGHRFILSKKENNDPEKLWIEDDAYIYETPLIKTKLNKENFQVKELHLKSNSNTIKKEISFLPALEMSILLSAFLK